MPALSLLIKGVLCRGLLFPPKGMFTLSYHDRPEHRHQFFQSGFLNNLIGCWVVVFGVGWLSGGLPGVDLFPCSMNGCS